MRAARWMALATVAVLAACGGDDNGTGPGNGGNGGAGFSATVAGDVQTNVKGKANFGAEVDPDLGNVFGVVMNEDDDASLIQIVRLGADPGAGNYNISDALNGNPGAGEWVAVAMSFDDNGQPDGVFIGTGGNIKITTKSGSAMKGTFTFTASGFVTGDPATQLDITVSGTFSATPAGQFVVRSATIRR